MAYYPPPGLNCERRALLSVRFSVLSQLNVAEEACNPIQPTSIKLVDGEAHPGHVDGAGVKGEGGEGGAAQPHHLHREGRQLLRRLPACPHRPQRLGTQPDEASDGEGGYHVSPTNLHLSG